MVSIVVTPVATVSVVGGVIWLPDVVVPGAAFVAGQPVDVLGACDVAAAAAPVAGAEPPLVATFVLSCCAWQFALFAAAAVCKALSA
jgi:hypothetical protein